MIYLNVGLRTDKPDWVNIKEEVARKFSLNYPDNSVDIICCIHFLEHFTYSDADKLLSEFYRVLKKDGCLRIAVPDLDIFLIKFLTKDLKFFGMRRGKLFPGNTLTDKLLFSFYHRGHKYFYNIESLRHKLNTIGFKSIEVCKYKRTKIDDKKIVELDKRPIESLIVECRKE